MNEVQQSFLAAGSGADWAAGWLDALFRGAAPLGLAGNTDSFNSLAAALRQALGIYSVGMLVIAGLLLLWHVATIVAETAQTGIPMGRRVNQLWAPLRFVFAIGLLLPVSGGLNMGQFLIVKIASQGSGLASRAWESIVETVGEKIATPVAPRSADATTTVLNAVEVELCRAIYQQAYKVFETDAAVARAGGMSDARRIPPDRLVEETWRHTNELFPDTALCGEYRLVSPSASMNDDPANDSLNKTTQTTADSVRAGTERLMLQARMLAERIASGFLSNASGATPEASATITALINDQNKILENQLKAQTTHQDRDAFVKRMTAAGWIGAGAWLLDISKQQSVLDTNASRMMADIKTPLFGRRIFSRAAWMAAAEKDPVLKQNQTNDLVRYALLYDKTTQAMRAARGWLYKSNLSNIRASRPDQLDLTDRMGPYEDGAIASRLLGRLLYAGMESYGVMDQASTANDKPFARLIEMGRGYTNAGSWLFGMTSPALSEPSSMAMAVLYAGLALLMLVAGFVLTLLVPFLPFYRFLLAGLAWLVAVFGAVAALPLVALAHMNPTGEGLVGPVARRAYWMWLAIFMRPILVLSGLVLGALAMALGVSFVDALFGALLTPLFKGLGDGFVTARVAFALVYAALIYGIANMSFRGISVLPEDILDWLSAKGGLPETVVKTGAEIPTASLMARLQTAPAALLAAGREAIAGRNLPALSGKQSRAISDPNAKTKEPRTAQNALFPQVQERPIPSPLSVQAEAKAQAFAKADGRDGSHAAAAASASGQSGPGGTSRVEAHAMTAHMPSIKEPEVKGLADRTLDLKKDPTPPNPRGSAEQSGSSQDKENTTTLDA